MLGYLSQFIQWEQHNGVVKHLWLITLLSEDVSIFGDKTTNVHHMSSVYDLLTEMSIKGYQILYNTKQSHSAADVHLVHLRKCQRRAAGLTCVRRVWEDGWGGVPCLRGLRTGLPPLAPTGSRHQWDCVHSTPHYSLCTQSDDSNLRYITTLKRFADCSHCW